MSSSSKIDGVAISLTYENGLFTVGATRGDGEHGDDVTHNLKTDPRAAAALADRAAAALFEARGEVYMTRAELARINRDARARRARSLRQPAQPDGRHRSSCSTRR